MPTFLGEKRSGSGRVRSSKGVLIYEEDWEGLIEADNKFQERFEILATNGMPRVNQTIRGNAVCKTADVTRDSIQPLLWHAKASFSSEVEEGTSPSDPNAPDDPALWIPVRETKWEEYSEIARVDKNGDVIRNTAGVPFPVLPQFKRMIPVWEFWQFDLPSVTDEDVIEWNETYNENTFKGKEPFTLLLNVGFSAVGFYYGFRRRLTQYFLKYNRKNWKHRIPSEGDQQLVGGVLQTIFADGVPTVSPLDEDGALVPDQGQPYIVWFDEYTPSDFSFLKI